MRQDSLATLRATVAGALLLTGASVAHAASERVVYSFQGGAADGAQPVSPVVEVGGVLYGTTSRGGLNFSSAGTVFGVTPAGAETVLHRFAGGATDGNYPVAGLTPLAGALYGVTSFGGTAAGCGGGIGCGTVFRVTPTGDEQVVYAFKSRVGSNPQSALVPVGNALYGTATEGGAYGHGSVFRVLPSGQVAAVYSFQGGADGAGPGPLIHVQGVLYGVTAAGGSAGLGTVFSVTRAGAETVLHSFGGGAEGATPVGALLRVGGTFYGVTSSGGSANNGTVYKLTADGNLTTIHSFGIGFDGFNPRSGLLNVNGTFYGTTLSGGNARHGTVYKIKPNGAESVAYAFSRQNSDGQLPVAPLINVGGTLYGTTELGGEKGLGTVFALTP